MLTEMLLH